MQNNDNKSTNPCQYGTITKQDIIGLQGCSGSDALVYMVLCIHAFNGKRIAHPSVTTIRNITSLSRASVLRSLARLRDDYQLITPVGKTKTGVVKYTLGGIQSETGIQPETGSNTETGIQTETGRGIQTETGGVSNPIPIKHKTKENIVNTSLAKHADEILFCKLWNKWHSHVLCQWRADNPLQVYRQIRATILQLWKQSKASKDMSYELQVLDIYLMQQTDRINDNGERNTSPRFWGFDNWPKGVHKWLASTTKSHMGGGRKEYLSKAIHLTSTEHILGNTVLPNENTPTIGSAPSKPVHVAPQPLATDLRGMYARLQNIEQKYGENSPTHDVAKLHEQYEQLHDLMEKHLNNHDRIQLQQMDNTMDFVYYITFQREQ
jgi:hypothetical protein